MNSHSKKNRHIKFLIYIGLLLFCIFLSIYINKKGRLSSASDTLNKNPFSILADSKIDHISITHGKDQIIIRENNGEYFVSPGNFKADPGLVKGLIKIATESVIQGIVSINKERQKDFGISNDKSVKLTFFIEKNKNINILIGDFAPDRLSCYISLPGEKKTFMTQAALKYASSYDPKHWKSTH